MSYLPYAGYTKKYDSKTGKLVTKWPIKNKKCAVCRNPFQTRNPHKMYCSKRCNNANVTKNRRKNRNRNTLNVSLKS